MNIAAKIWSWIITVWGTLAILGGLFAEESDGYMILGGLVILVSGIVALTYIWKDDDVKRAEKQAQEELRIASIIEERMSK